MQAFPFLFKTSFQNEQKLDYLTKNSKRLK
jgi:hypothetical protein